ncbi:MAG: hypothetical protein AVDCRST_MAG18-1168 [uncultured Thermomicrobiales bacterium]|uniref:Uncharacterized protein n=1 Tax=uncultured Thermomicrobiales bacterium TaxID=1645740 RepID=A0A6J4UZ21_9BACT|nr:MAG: hypothetical protein AVDCRST_MAG18-1168 [uncultured Thermomicrobiales bacterium]
MRHAHRACIALFYGAFRLLLLGAAWALAAADRPVATRLAPMALAYALLLLTYTLARLAARWWSRPVAPAVWGRIGRRLLEDGDLDEEFEPDPAWRARFWREAGPTVPDARRAGHGNTDANADVEADEPEA